MKSNKIKIVRIVLLLVWMSFIFYMSAQNGEQSGSLSDKVTEIINALGLNFEVVLGSNETLVIRKLAHITEYFILTVLIFRVLDSYARKFMNSIFSVVFTFLYACSDEIHQLFVSGRGGCFTDVLIDTLGGIIAIIIINILYKYKNNREIKQSQVLR